MNIDTHGIAVAVNINSIRRNGLFDVILAGVITLMLLIPFNSYGEGNKNTDAIEQIWVDSANSSTRGSSNTDYVQLVRKVGPSVVNIVVTYGPRRPGIMAAASSDWGTHRMPGIAQGSGFIIHPNGYILTNYHVINGASKITVRLIDDNEFDAEIMGIDPPTDVALIKIDNRQDLPAVPLGNSDLIDVGEPVMAIGNPLGLTHTVTSGIVSALGRRNLTIEGKDIYADFLQTDASINPGNSGGPLIGRHGDVIGMNTAINRQGQGIGFALPINMIKALLPQLYKNGYVVRNWLGVRVQELHPLLAASFGMKHSRGALVAEVVEGSPAAKAGLQSGDIITAFNDVEVRTSEQLPWLVSTYKTEGLVELSLFRSNKQLNIAVHLEIMPDQQPPRFPKKMVDDSVSTNSPVALGIEVGPLSQALIRQLGISREQGVVITVLPEKSPARAAGLRQRDVVVAIGDSNITNEQEFHDVIANYESRQVIRLKVIRGSRVVYIAFER